MENGNKSLMGEEEKGDSVREGMEESVQEVESWSVMETEGGRPLSGGEQGSTYRSAEDGTADRTPGSVVHLERRTDQGGEVESLEGWSVTEGGRPLSGGEQGSTYRSVEDDTADRTPGSVVHLERRTDQEGEVEALSRGSTEDLKYSDISLAASQDPSLQSPPRQSAVTPPEESINRLKSTETLLQTDEFLTSQDEQPKEHSQPPEDETCGEDVSLDECDILKNIDVSDLFEEPSTQKKKRKKCSKIPQTPFTHVWSFGFNADVPVLNLTSSSESAVLYAASHIVIKHNYVTNKMERFEGHGNQISSISTDKKGRWLATADAGINSSAIVWDCKKRIPIYTYFDDGGKGFRQAKLSPNGKLLVTASYDDAITVTEWARDKPPVQLDLPPSFGSIVKISFNRNSHIMEFALTSVSNVGFVVYSSGELNMEVPTHQAEVHKTGEFTDTVYLQNSAGAVTSTTFGFLFVWKVQVNKSGLRKELVNYFNLTPDPIYVLNYINEWIVTGDGGGNVLFFNEDLRLEFSFRDNSFGPIIYIDFNKTKKVFKSFNNQGILKTKERTLEGAMKELFNSKRKNLPEFIVVTYEGHLYYINAQHNYVETLIKQSSGNITTMDASEDINLLCTGSSSSELCIYDLKSKKIINRLVLHSLKGKSEQIFKAAVPISCVKFSPQGDYLCCCQSDGAIWILNPLTLALYDNNIEADCAFTKMEFSSDGLFVAILDTSLCVWVFQVRPPLFKLDQVGMCRQAHKFGVVALLLKKEGDGTYSLLSVGKDKRLVRYQMRMKKKDCYLMEKQMDIRIEQFAVPFSAMYHPSKQSSLLLSNSQYKYRILDLDNKIYTSTTQGPVFQNHGPITHLAGLNCGDYILYQVGKLVGLEKLPLDGNPYKTMSMIVTGTKVINIAFSHNKKYLLTLGRFDKCVHMWRIIPTVVGALEKLGGSGLEPYYCLLEGGRTGPLMRDMKDYFVYCQVLHSGEGSLGPREVSDRVRACDVVNIMAALGYYPSQYEIECLYAQLGIFNGTNEINNTSVGFEDFVKLYINHRPLKGVTKYLLKKSFETFCSVKHSDTVNLTIAQEDFITLLTEKGDCWSSTELFNVLWNLSSTVQEDNNLNKKEDEFIADLLPKHINFYYLYDELMGMKRKEEDSADLSFYLPYKTFVRSRSTAKKVSFKA